MAYNKYKNQKVTVDGIKFDSMKEARRYKELKLLERGGAITDLTLQPKFELIPTIKREGHKTERVTYYIADFAYTEKKTGKEVVEDVKGYKTKVYKLKKKMFLYKYPQYDFREI